MLIADASNATLLYTKENSMLPRSFTNTNQLRRRRAHIYTDRHRAQTPQDDVKAQMKYISCERQQKESENKKKKILNRRSSQPIFVFFVFY